MQSSNSHIPDEPSDGNGNPSKAGTTTQTIPRSSAPHRSESRIGAFLGISVLILAIALGVGFFFVQRHKSSQESELAADTAAEASAPPEVDVVPVEFAPALQPVSYPGNSRGWYQSTIYARVSGYVGRWNVDIGDKVKKGDVLATIDTPDLDAQLMAAQHELSVAQAQVNVEEANKQFAETTYHRWRDSPKGVVSDQEREEKKAEYQTSVARLAAANAKASADQADVDRIQAMEAYKDVDAPFDGVITARHIDIGDLVIADRTANTTSLYDMAQINKIRAFIDVPQRATAGIQPGVAAEAVANEFPGQVFRGTITRTSTAIDSTTRTLHVEVDIDNPDQVLVPGMYLQVTLDIAHKGLLEVPASALIFRSNGPEVAVIGPRGHVHYRNVTIAIDNGDYVELSAGVSAGDRVALNISNQIGQGQEVTATDASKGEGATGPPAATAPGTSSHG